MVNFVLEIVLIDACECVRVDSLADVMYFSLSQEKLASVKNTPSKGENRQAKRKLYSSGSASEDEGMFWLRLRIKHGFVENDPLRGG